MALSSSNYRGVNGSDPIRIVLIPYPYPYFFPNTVRVLFGFGYGPGLSYTDTNPDLFRILKRPSTNRLWKELLRISPLVSNFQPSLLSTPPSCIQVQLRVSK